MKMTRLRVSGAVGVAAAMCITIGPAGAAATPAHVVRLTPDSGSTQRDLLFVIAGSPTTLVYERQRTLASDLDERDQDAPRGPQSLFARTASGHTVSLGAVPGNAETFYEDYTLAGSSLAAAVAEDDDPHPPTNVVDHWNTVTGHRVHVVLPAGDRYVAAAPGGFLYVTPNGVLKRRSMSGAVTALGAPFGAHGEALYGVANASGLVVGGGGDGRVAYVPFAAPHTVVPLDNPTSDPGSPLVVSPVVCRAASSTYAACLLDDVDDELLPCDAVLIPLDGSQATLPDKQDCETNDVALAGDHTLVWSQYDQSSNTEKLFTTGPGQTTPTATAVSSTGALASAYGATVTTTRDRHSLIEVQPGGQPQTLLSAPKSPVSIANFALTPGRIVYVDDQSAAADPAASQQVLSRRLSIHGSRLRKSAPKRISDSAQLVGDVVAASGSTTAYATATPTQVSALTMTLHMVSPAGRATIDNVSVNDLAGITLSGHRLFVPRQAMVYNAKTGSRHRITLPTQPTQSMAISGHFLAYASRAGVVYRENLDSQQVVRVAKAPSEHHDYRVNVYVHGDYVGWHAQPARAHLPNIDKLRNAKTMGPVVTLHHTLYALTGAGAVLVSGREAEATNVTALGRPATFWLHHYSGQTVALLPKQQFARGPQIAGGVVAWADATGALKAAPLPR